MCAKLNIFMIGGRRCGKTTVLSKIYRQFNNVLHHSANEDSDLFSINLDAVHIPDIAAAESAVNSIFNDNEAFDEFIVEDYNPTQNVSEIKFKLSPVGPGQPLEIGFKDIPGEWCNSKVLNDSGTPVDNIVSAKGLRGGLETKKAIEFVVDYIQCSTVTIIAIDTPAMMEQNGAFNNAINRVGPITEAFKTALLNNGGNENISDKLILFVPLKCEKYVVKGDGTIDDDGMKSVAQRVRESYAELIDIIGKNPVLVDSVSAAILPIVTIKEVLWAKYGCKLNGEEASVFNDKGNPRSFPEYYDPRNLIYSFFAFRNFTMHEKAKCQGSESEFCEQPLVYSLIYSMRHAVYRAKHPAVSRRTVIGVILETALRLLFGFFVNNNAFETEADRLSQKKMKRGNGFEIIQDNRGFLK